MKPQIFALMTAMAWGIGSYFEKKGLHLGNLPPQLGLLIRTLVAAAILIAITATDWRLLTTAGWKPLTLIGLGGGVLAGTVGLICFYAAIKAAPLGDVMPIAFTSPLFGVLMAVLIGHEPITLRMGIGMALTVGGIAVLTMR